MKVVSTEALTKLIQLVKSAFIKVDDVVEVSEIETETSSEITLATVATSGSYNDLSNKPTIPAAQVNSDWNATTGVAQILNKPTIPTVNNPTITITQGGVSKGSFTLNQATGDTIALDAGGGSSYTAGTGIDIISNTISVAIPTLTNKDTSNTYGIIISDSITGVTSSAYTTAIGGRLNLNGGSNVAIGDQAKVNGGCIAIGASSEATGTSGVNRLAVAIGLSAKATANNAIQLGYGTNSEANSFYVGTSASDNWKLLGSDGKIPSGRLPIAASVSSSSTNNETVGAKLFYDTCGDIETAINTIRGV